MKVRMVKRAAHCAEDIIIYMIDVVQTADIYLQYYIAFSNQSRSPERCVSAERGNVIIKFP